MIFLAIYFLGFIVSCIFLIRDEKRFGGSLHGDTIKDSFVCAVLWPLMLTAVIIIFLLKKLLTLR